MIDIAVLPGDGTGPQVIAEAMACLELLSLEHDLNLRLITFDFGGAAIERHGDPLPAATLEACRGSAAVLVGAVGGGSRNEAPNPSEAGLDRLREGLGLFVNLHSRTVLSAIQHGWPPRAELSKDADVLFVQAIARPNHRADRAANPPSRRRTRNSVEIERVAHVAFRAARHRRRKVSSVDRLDRHAGPHLWQSTVMKVAAQYPDIATEHLSVDECAMGLLAGPRPIDVILAEDACADILQDQWFGIAGPIGLLVSASLSEHGPGLFGPTRGLAAPGANVDVANPAGAIASAVMMLEELGLGDSGRLLSDALHATLREGCRTSDLGGSATCCEFGARVRQHLEVALGRRRAFRQLIAMNRGCCG